MQNLTKKLLVISLLAPSFYCHASDLANLSNEPLFLSGNARGMVMLLLGKDHTLASAAYNDAASLTSSSNSVTSAETRFNPAYEYYGYFDPYKCYTYANSKFSPSTNISNLASTDCSGNWSGNFLNYVTTSRMDALRKALYGGKRYTDDAAATTLESSFIPADAHSWAKSYDPYDPAQIQNGSHAFPIHNFTPFANSDKIFFGRVNQRSNTAADTLVPELKVLNLSNLQGTNCNNNTTLTAADIQAMRTRHWTESGTPVTDIFLVKPSDSTICIINGATFNKYTLRVDVCVDGKINSNNREECVLYPNNHYKPTGILQAYKDKSDFGLMTGSYDQHLSGGVLRRNMADFNRELNSQTGQFTLTRADNTGSGIIDALNKIRISKFSMTSGTFDTTKFPWVLYDNANNALNYIDCLINNSTINYGLNTSNSLCRDWGNPIGEMLAEAMRYFYETGNANRQPTSAFTATSTVDDELKLKKEAWLDPFNDTTLTSNGSKRPWCAPAYNLIISNNNVNFDADDIPTIGAAAGNFSSWSTYADKIGTRENLYNKNYIIGSMIGDSNKQGVPISRTLTSLSNVRGTPSEPSKMGSYAAAGLAYWGNTTNIFLNKPASSAVRTLAIAIPAPMPDIKIKVGTRNITLVPTAKSVRKWKYNIGQNPAWDDANASHSPISPASTQKQPSNEIVGFHVDSISDTSGIFSVSFADVEQGSDWDTDMTATYQYQVDGNNLTVKVRSDYASGDIEQHAGYVLSGVSASADGLYMDIRDMPDCGIANNVDGREGDTLYYLDTPDASSNATRGVSTTKLKPLYCARDMVDNSVYFRGTPNNWGATKMALVQPNTYCLIQAFGNESNPRFKVSKSATDWLNAYPAQDYAVTANKTYKVCFNWSTNAVSATEVTAGTTLDSDEWRSVSRTFTVGQSAPDTFFLKPPLWYAAKWGSFDSSKMTAPDLNNPDSTPNGYYPITAPGDLKTQFNSAFGENLSLVSSTASAITTSSYRLTSTSIQFTSEFIQAFWSGNVIAKAISSSGVVGSVLWDAASILDAKTPSSRVIFSYDPVAKSATIFDSPSVLTGDAGELTQTQINNLLADSGKSGASDSVKLTFIQNLISYLRGDRTNEGSLFRKRAHVLGDIVHSTPTYGKSIDNRPFVIVGSNDGMVHVFDANSTTAAGGGSEIFAYVPSQTLRASSDVSNPESLAAYAKTDYQSKHRYYVDGDISLATIDSTKRMAFGALGQGGRGIYALDLSTLSNVTTASASNRVKWEFTHANMGFNQAAPAVVDVKLAAGKTRVVIFSNGFNASVLPTAGSCGAYPCGTVFILNANTGELIRALTTTVMSGLSEPAVIDKDGDGYADTIYAGDLQGNLWRFDISNADKASWSNGTRIFTATASNGVNRQPITSRPSASKHASGGVMVYFGTGKYLETTDSTASNQTYSESLYGIWDNPQNNTVIERSSLFARSITDNGTSRFIPDATPTSSNTRGWYMDLPVSGERIITNTEFVYGKLNVTTMYPSSDNVNCINGGNGWLMQLKAADGSSYVTGTDAAKASANQKTQGIPSNLNATMATVNGNLVDTSTTQAHSLIQTSVTNPSASAGALTWKQIY